MSYTNGAVKIDDIEYDQANKLITIRKTKNDTFLINGEKIGLLLHYKLQRS
jgi:hypothetical protein